MKNVLAVAMMFLAAPVLADCVSCGPGGDCYSVSESFSGNCECKIRVRSGVTACTPVGVCDPGSTSSCPEDGDFPEVSAPRVRISTQFLDDMAEVNPLLAGAVWGGVEKAGSLRNGSRAEVQGTMGQDGRTYTYRTEVKVLPKGAATFVIQVQEEASPIVQRFEGSLANAGRSGRFVEVKPKGKTPVYSWGAR